MRKVEWHTVQAALDSITDAPGNSVRPKSLAVLVVLNASAFDRRRQISAHQDDGEHDGLVGEFSVPRPRYLH